MCFCVFVGVWPLQVANPHDMLLWAKSAARRVKDEARAAEEAEVAAGLGLSSIRPEQLDQVRCVCVEGGDERVGN